MNHEQLSSCPNIVLVVMDTARAQELFEFPDAMSTIHRLASEGSNYTQAFANAPWTLPSHASLFTGTYSSKHGAHANHKYLNDDLPTLAEAFQTNGYETVAVSNNTWISEEFGFSRGFETFYKTWQYVQTETDFGEIARTKRGGEMIQALAARLIDGNPAVNIINAIYGQFFRKRNDDGAQRTNKWLVEWLTTRNRDDPFFLFVNYLEPHLEYRPPKALAERFLPKDVSYREAMEIPQDAWKYIVGEIELTNHELATLQGLYQAELAYLDRRIGELRKILVCASEWDNTVFIVTSDHGENIGNHGFMDHQYCLYDTLLHIPLVIYGKDFMNKQINNLVQLTDLAPTLLDVAGINAPKMHREFQGQSLHPDVQMEPRKYAIAEYMAPQPSMEALRKQIGTLPDDVVRYDRSLCAIRTNKEKLIRGSDGTYEFYEMKNDPEESVDLADERSERIGTLEATFDEWLDSFEHADTSGTATMSTTTENRLEDLGYLQ